MKIAISGKGGTGKTTIAACVGVLFSKKGFRVILIDADPDSNLQTTLGWKGSITPLVEMKHLIQERTGVTPGEPTIIFSLNPKVDDIPEKYFLKKDNILLGIMGTIRGGNLGCACPENAFLKALLRHLILRREDVVILDMEAGVEHLGRGVVAGIDWLLVTAEPGEKSVETTLRIAKLAGDLKLKKIAVIGNKIENKEEQLFLRNRLEGLEIIGFIPYFNTVKSADTSGIPPWEKEPLLLEHIEKIVEKLGGKDERGSTR